MATSSSAMNGVVSRRNSGLGQTSASKITIMSPRVRARRTEGSPLCLALSGCLECLHIFSRVFDAGGHGAKNDNIGNNNTTTKPAALTTATATSQSSPRQHPLPIVRGYGNGAKGHAVFDEAFCVPWPYLLRPVRVRVALVLGILSTRQHHKVPVPCSISMLNSRTRRSTIEVHPELSEAPQLRNSTPHPKTDFRKNQTPSRGIFLWPKYTVTSFFATSLPFRRLKLRSSVVLNPFQRKCATSIVERVEGTKFEHYAANTLLRDFQATPVFHLPCDRLPGSYWVPRSVDLNQNHSTNDICIT